MIAHLRHRADAARGDRGMTLVELIVAMVVGVLALMLMGNLFIEMLGKQTRITESALSTEQVQGSFTSLQTSVRNAARVEVQTRETNGDLLIAATGGSGTGSQERCEAWFYVKGTTTGAGRLYRRSLLPAAASSGVLSGVTSANVSGWTLMVDRADSLLQADGTLLPVFARLTDGAVVISLEASASQVGGSAGVVRVETKVSPLPQSFPASEACFS